MTYTDKILAEFDKEFPDPMTKKYGVGFALYCSNCSGKNLENIKSFLTESIEESIERAVAEESARVLRLINLYGTPNCENLHHNKKQQHEIGETCPVVKEINDLLSSLQEKETKGETK